VHISVRNYIILICWLPLTAWAQLQVYPLERSNKIVNTPSQAARVKADPLSLPFWDDFSFTQNKYPVDALWFNNKSVLVSSGQGINAPTLNVATFDGLTADGTPYSPSATDYLDFGYRDTLETQPIKMSEVTLPFRNSVFLSFFFQWSGNGEPPDFNDFLRLEFKNDSGIWEEIVTTRKDEGYDETQFYYYNIRINETKFFHDDFRFRFVSFGRKSGQYDAWHIDYVYLDKGRIPDNSSFPDRAVHVLPTTNFNKYYSIPTKHFLESMTITPPSFGLSNLEGISQPMNYQLGAIVKSFKENVLLSEYAIQLEDSASISPTITPFEKRIIQTDATPDFSNFDIAADSIVMEYQVTLRGGDTIRFDYGDIDFRVNDTINFNYSLSNYYAYDDGEAEYSAGLTQPGNQLAYRFDMETDGKDTINGLFIHYPLFAGTSPTSIEFFIRQNITDPEQDALLYSQVIPVSRTTNNQFIEIDLLEGEQIHGVPVQGSFYIGYTEPLSGRVRIGLDKSNDSGDRLFYRLSSSSAWAPNDRIAGSFMIRPRFGKGSVTVGLPETPATISFYPNPNAGEFYIKGHADVLQVINITGQSIGFSSEELGDQKRISLSNPVSGVYFVKYRTGFGVSTTKILVRN